MTTRNKPPEADLPQAAWVVTEEERMRYDALFNQLKVDKDGFASHNEIEGVFLQSGVSQQVLTDVWIQCDMKMTDKLNANQFALAMSLIKQKRNSNDLPQKKVVHKCKRRALETEEENDSLFTLPQTPWVVTKEERENYNILFHLLDTNKDGLVSKDETLNVFQQSGLAQPVLSHIWTQCDIKKTGMLNAGQFAVAMWLIKQKTKDLSQLKKRKRTCRIPKSKKKATKTVQSVPSFPETPWLVSNEDQARYTVLFHQLDADKDGFVTNDEIQGIFLQSGLPQQVLDLIWDQCDLEKTGKVNEEQFALAMWLIKETQKNNNSLQSCTPRVILPRPKDKDSETETLCVVNNEDRARYLVLFHQLDDNKEGFVSRQELQDIFQKSSLPQQALDHIWDRCDVKRSGKLTEDQFIVLMYLINNETESRKALVDKNISLKGRRKALDTKNFKKALCPFCDRVCLKKVMNKHIQRMHKIDMRRFSMACLECDKKFSRRLQLVNHLKSQHNKVMEKEILAFSSYNDFEKWLETEEKKTTSKYIKPNGERKTDFGSTLTLVCCREKTYKKNSFVVKNRKRALKRQGYRKSMNTCTSFVYVKKFSSPSSVVAHYYKTHYGHSNEIQHLGLTRSEKESIAVNLAFGVPEEKIIEDARQLANPLTPSRMDTLSRKDIANVRKAYNIGLLGGTEMVNIDLWVNEEKEKDYNSVKYYKKCGDIDENNCFKEEDFCLIIMTEEQVSAAKLYGKRFICVDSTHALGGNDRSVHLFTILTVDEFGESFPIVYMYSSKVDRATYIVFYTTVKEACGQKIYTSYFMSDMADTIYSAWVEVMGKAKCRLLCSWHVLNDWTKHLKKVSGLVTEKKALRKRLQIKFKALLFERDETLFLRHFGEFQMDLKNPHLKRFAKYWEERYAANVMEWAHCFRGDCPVTKNIHLEPMHKILKYFRINRREGKGIDESIASLFELVPHKKKLEVNLQHYEKDISRKSKTSIQSNLELFEAFENEFSVLNKKSGEINVVKREKDKACCQPGVQIHDNHICKHMFACTCYQFCLDESIICEHIQFIANTCLFEPDSEGSLGKVDSGIVLSDGVYDCLEETEDAGDMREISMLLCSISKKVLNDEVPVGKRKEIIQHLQRLDCLLQPQIPEIRINKLKRNVRNRHQIEKQEKFPKTGHSLLKKRIKKALEEPRSDSTVLIFADNIQDDFLDSRYECQIDHEEVVG